ncbi:1-phosphatidylinositol 3-phosphate 5-kinase-like isoform X1 [Haliotis rufescens]|uniref:1-phosphatidylinositol 3-phosphate 5-kinase-like isoform X1 n=1 Tax=Haliotis rufescens TaxID=6454 RepID=UPI00201EC630|nr:1-phosphatidylinositol 3-phosphate 5-kinase-like isoform X1 [Haliotis rufescens]
MGTRKPSDISTGLTEFGPLSSEVRPAGNFFTRLLKRARDDSDNSSGSSTPGSRASSREASVERTGSMPIQISQRVPSKVSLTSGVSDEATFPSTTSIAAGNLATVKGNDDSSSQSEESSEAQAVDDHVQKRTLSSVLSRLGNILDRRSNTLQTYKDSDFKQYWMPDSSCKECYDCGDKFTTFRRRHHCRICGQIFCSKCCNQELPGKIIGYKGGIRVCIYCCKVVLRYAQQSDQAGDVKVSREDLRSLSIDFESGSFQDLGIWSPNLRRIASIREDSPQTGSVSPQDTGSTCVQKNVPFDLTPHADFSIQESLLRESKILIQDSIQLRELWWQMNDLVSGVEMQSHRVRLRTYHKCIMGKELVNWLLTNDKAANRDQAVAIGQALVFANFLEPVSSQLLVFQDDFCLYKPGEHAGLVDSTPQGQCQATVEETAASSEPLWFKEIQSMDRDDSSMGEDQRSSTTDSDQRKSISSESGSRAIFYVSERSDSGSVPNDLSKLAAVTRDGLDEPLPSTGLSDDFLKGSLFVGKSVPASADTITCPHGWRNADQLREENGEKLAYERLSKAHSEMWDAMLKQLLSQHGLSLGWQQVISYIILQVSRFVRPDVQVEGDDPDIRKYIHIKKIPGDLKQDTFMLHGVVFTKNIAHKKMQQQIPNPQILLLKGAIEYQRVENKFSSLEPQILQEREFLKNSVAKIAAFRPSVLIVEKSVSRLAQEFLLDVGITLVFNVKQSVMERVARITQADIVSSIDGLVSRPKLGFCHSFKCQPYPLPNGGLKTVVVMDGCATHLGCTICLRGGTPYELRKVKEVVKMMSYTSYNSLLEISYCMDEFALPPPNPDEIQAQDDFDLAETIRELTLTEDAPERVKNEDENKQAVTTDKPAQDQQIIDVEGKSGGEKVENCVMAEHGSSTVKLDEGNEEDSEVVLRKGHSVEKDTDSKRTSKDSCKRQSVERTELTDLSDPLHSYQNSKDESIFDSKVSFQEHKQTKQWQFKKALIGLVLSISPYHKYEVPYLETAHGSKCELRKYLPEDIYWSQLFEGEQGQRSRSKYYDGDYSGHYTPKSNIHITEAHPFILQQLTAPLHENTTQALLADFRARGGRINVLPPLDPRFDLQRDMMRKAIFDEQSENEKNKPGVHWEKKIDCLDTGNHQKMAVLFSSYSHKSANHPNPCVYPWVVKMEFYGNNDITLGGFLERYCFRKSYSCPSVTCDTPMVHHIRRFAHDKGYLNVVLKKLDSVIAGGQNNILMWSWCCRCKQVTPVVPITVDTWNLSFAKYLELRFHGVQFSRRASAEPCAHSLHQDHNQYFGYNNMVASFRYTELLLRELALPPIIVSLHQIPTSVDKLKDVVRSITNKGMEKYSAILECTMKLRNETQSESTARAVSEFVTEQQSEKSRLRDLAQDVQQKLQDLGGDGDSSGLEMKPVFLEIHDDLIKLKRLVAEAVVRWNNKIQEFLTLQQKKYKLQASGSKKDRDKDNLSVSADELDRSSPRYEEKLLHSRKETDSPNIDVPEGDSGGPSSLSPQVQERGGSSNNLEALREEDGVDARQDKKGMVRRTLMSSLWSAPGFTPITMPFDPAEHYLLPPCEKIPVVVYDYEPSSVIAYALSCGDYHVRLREYQCCCGSAKEQVSSLSSSKGGSKSGDVGGGAVESVLESEDPDNYSVLTSSTVSEVDKSKINSKQTISPHIELQFSDSGARFYCKIYFAEPFRQLRKLIFSAGEEMFIRSLCRCKPWEAKGGKSGSTFCKTDDDRFILKQMSGMEVESFEKFGPEYFKYITRAYGEKRPTALAKILGVYRIGFRNTQTNHALKQDLLVLENLFYNRKITQTFDLKGSMRNRLVNTSGKREEELVLLDENLLKLSVESPLYMRPHSKTVLNAAISSDSEFLSSNLVMDYSLLVGLDEARKELVVGIIDYIRTFTWDKKLEMLVKSQIGIIGGQGKTPTVVSPQLYRSRFLEAMDRYFLHVPDQWSGLGSDFPNPCDSWIQTAQDIDTSIKR